MKGIYLEENRNQEILIEIKFIVVSSENFILMKFGIWPTPKARLDVCTTCWF
jgi:hypothetical protein